VKDKCELQHSKGDDEEQRCDQRELDRGGTVIGS
jgi:hypothetical protein